MQSITLPLYSRSLSEGSHQVLELISPFGLNGCSVRPGNLGCTRTGGHPPAVVKLTNALPRSLDLIEPAGICLCTSAMHL